MTCSKHGMALRLIKSPKLPPPPQKLQTQAAPIPTGIAQDALNNPVIQRYEAICNYFAMREQPFSTNQLVCVIREQLVVRNPSMKGRPPRLTKFVIEQVNGPWLQAFLPALYQKRSASSLNSLDQTGLRRDLAYATEYYALALAALFEQPEDAIFKLEKAKIRGNEPLLRVNNAANTDIQHELAIAKMLEMRIQIISESKLLEAALAFGDGATLEEAALNHSLHAEQVLTEVRSIVRFFGKIIEASYE